MNKTRSFGVEVEYDIDYPTLKRKFSTIIRDVYGAGAYTCRNHRYESIFDTDKWHIKIESSTMGEVCTPVSNLEDIPKLKEVFKRIEETSLECDEDCGTHLHIDCGDIEPNKVLACWLYCEYAMFSCCRKDRAENSNCEKEVHKSLKNKTIFYLLSKEKMTYFNAVCISFHYYSDKPVDKKARRSVEIRCMEGMTDHRKLMAWIKFLVLWFDWVKNKDIIDILKCKPNSITFEDLAIEVGLGKRDTKYLMQK